METELVYNAKHDAYFNRLTDKWAEGQCADPDCQYCMDRPEKPSMVVETEVPKGNWHY